MKTFRVVGLDGKKPFVHVPRPVRDVVHAGGREALFSITSSPTNRDYLEFSIKKCGCVTDWLHGMEPGQQITLRGPYGNGFPVESDFLGRDLLFIAGGIGLAPLRSVIHYVRDRRDRYGQVDIVYGARSREDLVDYPEIVREWSKEAGLRVHLTIDREQAGWEGHVGLCARFCQGAGL